MAQQFTEASPEVVAFVETHAASLINWEYGMTILNYSDNFDDWEAAIIHYLRRWRPPLYYALIGHSNDPYMGGPRWPGPGVNPILDGFNNAIKLSALHRRKCEILKEGILRCMHPLLRQACNGIIQPAGLLLFARIHHRDVYARQQRPEEIATDWVILGRDVGPGAVITEPDKGYEI